MNEPTGPSHNDQALDAAVDATRVAGASEGGVTAGDHETVRVPAAVRSALQELLRNGYLEESGKPDIFRDVIVHEQQINEVLDPLDLMMRLDTVRGIAVVAVRRENSCDADSESDPHAEWSHPLVRRQRMTLEQSLLVAILRQAFLLHEQEVGVGGSHPAKIALDELLPQYLTYVEDSGSDARNETRLTQLLEQLKGYGIVTSLDANQEITIRPLIAHLADPASLAALLTTMREHANDNESAEVS